MIRRPPRSTQSRSSAASDVYKRQTPKPRREIISRFDKQVMVYLKHNSLMKAVILGLLLLHVAHQQEYSEQEIRKEIGMLIESQFVDSYFIGCGSAVRIGHVETRFNLHATKFYYGKKGSGQRFVTGIRDANDPNSLWLFKEAFGEPPCRTGKRIACGQRVRLEHVVFNKNLHTDNHYNAPFTTNQEVSLYGDKGHGDIDDDWIIVCTDEQQDYLKGGTIFGLKHAETNSYLYADNKNVYTEKNCRDCPVIGHKVVSSASTMNLFCYWKVVGVRFGGDA
eukprot:TRINITY_DN9806_c0_g1_i24.p1 TRINITY_DN9806_c0_g1~~TRINITY_DN9806_c0_g1_i24.p1  ORF type:complete len:287 (-),score=45.43 TRINITY_DN9806_c0_g1_i24:238-1074(-)